MIPADVAGCNRCGTRWADRAMPCWMCHRPGDTVTRPHIPTGGLIPAGMWREVDRARENGPTLTDDPCGGGPL